MADFPSLANYVWVTLIGKKGDEPYKITVNVADVDQARNLASFAEEVLGIRAGISIGPTEEGAEFIYVSE